MIDPLHSLTFSMQANPGVYALMIGSGVSRSAQIPTGWEITIDLVRKLAALENEKCGDNPASWYIKHYGKEPDYSDLLDAIAKTPAERHQLIRAYIEPSKAELAENIKTPTVAHRSIANLVVKGFIRIIITTNFDRLMETALAEAGVVASVLSTEDQVHGAMPLIHTNCCVFKVHGDYLDTRIRNTPAELRNYPKDFNDLLDRILDEFGMIVCGWSAEWDPALRAAIERAVSRRFSHFWVVCGEPNNTVKDLINHRQGQILKATDADSFFTELGRQIEALEQFSRPHPLSTDLAVTRLKSYLAEHRHRIHLADFISGEVERVINDTSTPAFATNSLSELNKATFTARIRAYEAACETLVAMASVGGYWIEDWHHGIWQTALSRLSQQLVKSGFSLWIEMQRYPATLLLYALGLGAVQSGEKGLSFLGIIFGTAVYCLPQKELTAVELLPPFCLFSDQNVLKKHLDGMNGHYAPLNDWIFALLKARFQSIETSDERLSFYFDKLEILMALSFAHHDNFPSKTLYFSPLGCFGYRTNNLDRIIEEIKNSIERLGDNSPYVKSRIFGDSAQQCMAGAKALLPWVYGLKWLR